MTDRNRELVTGRRSLVRERALSRNGTKLAFTFSFRKRHETRGADLQEVHGMEGEPHGHTLLQRLLQPKYRSEVSQLFKYGYY